MRSASTWIAVGVASIGIGMAALAPPAFVAYSFIGVGALVIVIATLGRWFKIVPRSDR